MLKERAHETHLATSFDLPDPWRKGWRLKIRDKETVEPPHVSLLRRAECWRICLRTGHFLDRQPSPDEVPRRLFQHINSRSAEFIRIWDAMYPLNPVNSQEPDDDDKD